MDVSGFTLSAHLRNKGRLNTALTRGQDGLAVVLRSSTLIGTRDSTKISEERSTLNDFVLDSHDRHLIYADKSRYTDAPEYKDLTQGWHQAKQAQRPRL